MTMRPSLASLTAQQGVKERHSRRATLNWIIRHVAAETGITAQEITGRRRYADVSAARHEAMRRAFDAGIPKAWIAKAFGVDDGAVRYAVAKA